MEGRKLQLTGGSTYVVSLPKRWVLDAGLKAGDTVFLETEGDGAVSVRPRPADKVPMRRRLFEEKGEERRDHLLRKLIGAYIGGFSFIEIRFPSEMAPFVRKVAREFSRHPGSVGHRGAERGEVPPAHALDRSRDARGCPGGPPDAR